MTRQFKTAKLQLKMVDEAHPKGINRLFNNVIEDISDEQIKTLGTIIGGLSGATYSGANVINTSSVNA